MLGGAGEYLSSSPSLLASDNTREAWKCTCQVHFTPEPVAGPQEDTWGITVLPLYHQQHSEKTALGLLLLTVEEIQFCNWFPPPKTEAVPTSCCL